MCFRIVLLGTAPRSTAFRAGPQGDGSVLYGTDSVRAAALRTFVGGTLLNTSTGEAPLNTAGLRPPGLRGAQPSPPLHGPGLYGNAGNPVGGRPTRPSGHGASSPGGWRKEARPGPPGEQVRSGCPRGRPGSGPPPAQPRPQYNPLRRNATKELRMTGDMPRVAEGCRLALGIVSGAHTPLPAQRTPPCSAYNC